MPTSPPCRITLPACPQCYKTLRHFLVAVGGRSAITDQEYAHLAACLFGNSARQTQAVIGAFAAVGASLRMNSVFMAISFTLTI